MTTSLSRRNRVPATRILFFTACLGLLPASCLAARPSERARLNVVFFLIDDLGWRDRSCYGSEY